MFTTTTKLDNTCHKQPRLTALLSVGDNIMPLSWHMPISKTPLRYAVCMREENSSHNLIKKHKQFALNFLDIAYINAYDTSGSIHGGDKFSLTNLSPKKADSIESTLIEEAYMIYECKLIDILNYGDHDIFIAEVSCIHNKQVDDVKPTLFLGEGYYDTTGENTHRAQR